MLLLVTVLLGILAGCGEATSPIMARVGNTNITEAQFTEYMEKNKRAFEPDNSQGLSPEQIRYQMFLQLINEEVALEEARRGGYGIDAASEQDIDRQIQNTLQSKNLNPRTMAEFDKAVADEYNASSYKAYRQSAARDSALDAYARSISIPGAPDQAVFIREVVVPVASEEEAEPARLEAAAYAEQLRAGASLDDIIQKYRLHPQVGPFEGEFGWLPATQEYVGPDFADAATKLGLNEWSDPVPTGLGWHVFQIIKRAPFFSWGAMMQSPDGYQFITAKVQEYKDKGEYQVYIDPASIPTPSGVTEQQ